ncbi:unnamed protein product [Aphanomyces euteiches]|nr:hypothetical protein Ae201684P_009374 [Aphanomyces euteiches]
MSTTAEAPSAPTNPISRAIHLSTAVEHSEIAAGEIRTTFVDCHLIAPSVDDDQRKPIDVVVVLDRSRSMGRSKLGLCKKTIEFLATQLTAQDRMGIVTYHSLVETTFALTRMTADGKDFLSQRLDAIVTDAGTNLSSGLFAGIAAVQDPNRPDNKEHNPVKSVLLLTDGEANKGVTDPTEFSYLLQKWLGPQESVHTFGYGSDHDATLLGQLADIGRGSYYFVQNVDGVALAFANCLGGLLSVVAQNIKLECIASPGVLIQSVKTKRPVTTVTNQVHYEVDMGDMFADESRDLLVEVQLTPQNPQESMNVVEFRLRYANVVGSSMDKASSTATISRPAIVKNDAVNEHVVVQKQRVLVAEAIEAAKALASRQDFEQGRKMLLAVKERLEADMDKTPTIAALLASLVNDLDRSVASMSSAAEYRSVGHGRMEQTMQQLWTQRVNNVDFEEKELNASLEEQRNAAPNAAARPYAHFNRFGNAIQSRMMKKAFEVTK